MIRFNIAVLAVLSWVTVAGSVPAFAADVSADLLRLRESARAYEHGEGVAKDPSEAVKLYCEGAKAGDPEAMYSLGWMYANGRGIPRDDQLAAYYFSKAAGQGHAPSEKMLRFVGTVVAMTPECMEDKKEVVAEEPEELDFGSEAQRRLAELVKRLAPEYGVAPRLALAVARTESNLNPRAVSVKNAQGLMQLIPDTATRFNVKKPFDPEQNVRGGLAYLRWLLAYFRGNVKLVVAAYNAGEGAVNKYLGVPPYAETKAYVQKILAKYTNEVHPFDEAITGPSPELGRIRSKKEKKDS